MSRKIQTFLHNGMKFEIELTRRYTDGIEEKYVLFMERGDDYIGCIFFDNYEVRDRDLFLYRDKKVVAILKVGERRE